MHPLVRKALRITLVALALFTIGVGVADIANGLEIVREPDGRMRPWLGIVDIAFGLLLLGFTIPRAWWRDPEV